MIPPPTDANAIAAAEAAAIAAEEAELAAEAAATANTPMPSQIPLSVNCVTPTPRDMNRGMTHDIGDEVSAPSECEIVCTSPPAHGAHHASLAITMELIHPPPPPPCPPSPCLIPPCPTPICPGIPPLTLPHTSLAATDQLSSDPVMEPINGGFKYSFYLPPTLSSIEPIAGPWRGGTPLTIHGSLLRRFFPIDPSLNATMAEMEASRSHPLEYQTSALCRFGGVNGWPADMPTLPRRPFLMPATFNGSSIAICKAPPWVRRLWPIEPNGGHLATMPFTFLPNGQDEAIWSPKMDASSTGLPSWSHYDPMLSSATPIAGPREASTRITILGRGFGTHASEQRCPASQLANSRRAHSSPSTRRQVQSMRGAAMPSCNESSRPKRPVSTCRYPSASPPTAVIGRGHIPMVIPSLSPITIGQRSRRSAPSLRASRSQAHLLAGSL